MTGDGAFVPHNQQSIKSILRQCNIMN